ncbi:GNAT family N-acetyltransferase [Ramlibacter sp. G-1-2-2]|uniref:GNAT family N-acetyltransferase n=1 Tax=Ramlibacter agri TaxID=2728837 RepID=A0A848GZX6_9BURK|nr:GNAT family N-acetyltransferase [Ramlibacter agri]NML44115.1 GNAT family N-acetyltransferase [Ramlibacter agri]
MQDVDVLAAAAGLRLRPFAGAEDFPRMVVAANACFAADGLDIIRTVEDMARDYAALRDSDPARDVVMAERGGELVGYARSMHWTQPDGVMLFGQLGFVPPAQRRSGIGRALLAWLEQRQRTVAAAHPRASGFAHHSFVTQGETARAQLLRRAGYAPVRQFLAMVRPDLEAIPDFPLPPGLEVRAVQPEHHRAIWDAHMEALRGVWGFRGPMPGDYETWLTLPTFQPHLWQIAWDTQTGEVAGQVKTFIDAEYNRKFGRQRGWTEFISVGERWRRRGLARALVVRALRAQRDAGMRDSELGVDSENADGASRIYADCGFREVKRNTAYRKPFIL